MTERFKSLILAIHDFQGSTYDLTLQGGVNALCNLINGLNNKSNRLEKENEQVKSDVNQCKILIDDLKRQNKKLKGRLNDLGGEYYD